MSKKILIGIMGVFILSCSAFGVSNDSLYAKAISKLIQENLQMKKEIVLLKEQTLKTTSISQNKIALDKRITALESEKIEIKKYIEEVLKQRRNIKTLADEKKIDIKSNPEISIINNYVKNKKRQ